MTVLALALTSLALSEPAPSPQPVEPGAAMVRLVDHYAYVGRRARRSVGGLRLGIGAGQLALGMFGAVSPRYTPAIRRTAYAQAAFGVTGIGLGLYGLLAPSPMEKLARSEAVQSLRGDPGSPTRLASAEKRWAEVAEGAAIARVFVGGAYLTTGIGATVVGAIFAFSPLRVVSDDEQLWAYSTLGTGLSLMLSGTIGLAIRSPAERGLSAYRAALGRAPDRRIVLHPTLGGAVLSGRF